MKTIEVIVNTDGTLKIDAVGFSGPDCEKATAFLEKTLGRSIEKQKKPEYHARRSAVGRQEIGR